MSKIFEVELHRYYGHQEPWVAIITGRDEKFKFAQQFVKPDQRSSSRSGLTGNSLWLLEKPGLYRVKEKNDRFFVLRVKESFFEKIDISRERALKIAALLDQGVSLEEAFAQTKKARTEEVQN